MSRFWTENDKKQDNHSEIPSREKVDRALTWDLDPIFPDDAAWEEEFSQIESWCKELAGYRGKISQSSDALLQFIRADEKATRRMEKLYVYASMRNDQDTANSHYAGMEARIRRMEAQFMAATAWYGPELVALPDESLEKFIGEKPELEPYRFAFYKERRAKEHMLSPEGEGLLAEGAQVLSSSENVFAVLDNADQKFPSIKDSEGKTLEITHGSYGKLMENRDRQVREAAFKNLYGVYHQFRNTYAATLSSTTQQHNFLARVRNFKSAREAALFYTMIPEAVYDQLLEVVHENLPLLHRWAELRKKLLGLDALHCWDLYVPTEEKLDFHYSIEEAKEMIFGATEIMGPEYRHILERAFSERWIDFVDNRGKRSGAYSGGAYDTAPYILMTWQGTMDNVYTLIHELGHSCHSYFTRHSQDFVYGDYNIFLAEIASTTNENLLTAYLLEHEKDPAVRRYILMNYLDGFKGTVFRQTQFADFEQQIHVAEQEGKALTADFLCDLYGDLNAEYYGPALVRDDEIALEWARIPHFYYDFYVYQYATGFSAASCFSEMMLKDGKPAVEAYLGYLKAGSSAAPLDVLKSAGLDMTSPEPVRIAMKRFEARLSELEKTL